MGVFFGARPSPGYARTASWSARAAKQARGARVLVGVGGPQRRWHRDPQRDRGRRSGADQWWGAAG